MDSALSRRERKKLETRERLVSAAVALFLDHGFEDTTVEQITEAAGVAKGTFFNYFDSKELILPAVADWRLSRIRNHVAEGLGAPASPVARIKLILRSVAEDPLIDRQLVRHLIIAVHHMDPRPTHALADLLAEQVRLAQGAGEIRRELDPWLVGAALRALFFQQMILWHCGYRPRALPDLLDAMVDMLMHGIATAMWSHSS